MEPSIRFCNSRDGTQLGYATIGAGAPLLHLPGFTTNIEFEWKDPEARQWIERVAERRLLVRCQRRGVGASQRQVDNVSLEAQVEDIAAVVDRLEPAPLAILAAYDAAPSAIAYTVAHSVRVSHLVLWAPYVREQDRGAYDAVADLARHSWRLFLRTWADLCFPTGPLERQRWYAEMVRQSVSAEVVAAYMAFMRDIDVSALLPAVRCPTLILHRAGDRYVRPAAGRMIAAALPEATLVPLEGDIGLPVLGDFGYLARMFDFLEGREGTVPSSTTSTSRAGVFRTVLFTDLVGHTEMMRRLGDERGREVLRDRERITRDLLKQHGGAAVKNMGDGFMASFASVTQAVDCAIAVQRAFADFKLPAPLQNEGLDVRAGLNAGEPIEEDGDLFGSTVILASRIAANAGPGEILIPEPLRHLLAGKSYVYADRGEVTLKGFDEPVRLYAVRWRE